MNRIKKKLNNRKGASITWALLIFLVCAVVGSAVLVAGTAAAGRMSKLAENDQRYYAVTSSAGLLRDILKESITVTRSASDATENAKYDINYPAGVDPLLKALVMEMLDWPDTTTDATDKNMFWTKDTIQTETLPDKDVTLTLTAEGNISGPVGVVSGSLKLNADGSLIAVISKDQCSMRLIFELNRSIDTAANTKTDVFTWKLKEARILSA